MITGAGASTLAAPAYIARMRYPIYYMDVVLDVARQYDFDPLLMFSLIRLDSLFDTTATAAAGEHGLTQVIPGTGEYIASQLQWPDYNHSDLFRPYAGIAFGAYYLDEQLERFDGNVPAALAGSLSSSLGCVGNRVYTKMTDDQFYAMIRGGELEAFMHELSTIAAANVALAEYHRDRRRTIVA